MVKKLENWPWSNYLITIDVVSASKWLDVDWLLGQFGKQRQQAIGAYARFVMEGKGLPSPLDQTRHQLLLGDDNFIGQYKQNKKPEALREISKVHRRILALSLDEYKKITQVEMKRCYMHIYLVHIRWPKLENILVSIT